MERVFIGKSIDRQEPIYLSKHSWDCGWYWGFGYLGNNNCSFHFESYLKGDKYKVTDHLSDSIFTQDDWWILRDLFIQAYALKKAAEVYQYGGHQTSEPGITDLIKNPDKAKELNTDLEKVLNQIWKLVAEASAKED